MPIDVKLLLPPNLNNVFLNDDFVLNEGSNYFTGKLSLSPSVNENKVALTFGISLVDTDLREPVDLKTIKTLQISNDPEFHANSTITISDWPYDSTAYDPATNNKVTGSNKNFIFTIDQASFGDPQNTSLGARTVDNSGSDLFIIENWPLSANGGLSTVYFKVTAESIEGNLGTFPNSLGIFDQIYWQPESGIKPGVPKVVTRAEGYTGKKSLFRFEAAQEGASNLYGTGVARYSADLIEYRPLPSTIAQYQHQFASNRTTTIFRNIFPDVTPPLGAIVLRRWDFDTATRSMVLASPGSLAVNTTESGTLVAGDGIRLHATYAAGANRPTIKTPDFFAQAHVSVQIPNDLCEYNLTIGFSKIEGSDTTTPSESLQAELKINVQNDSYGFMPQASVIKRVSGTGTTLQTTSISRKIIKDLADGGNLELYLSKLKRPSAVGTPNSYDEKFVLRGYFTPDSDKTRSYLLGSATLDGLGDFDYADGVTLGKAIAFVLVECIDGEIDYTIDEIINGTGRVLLDVDLGDCKTDDILIDTSLSTFTSYADWATAISNGTWIELNENDTTAGSGDDPDGYYLIADLPTDDGYNRSYAEINAAMPSFSDRTKISFDLKIVQGQFYVALSPEPALSGVTPDRPMGTRCDNSNENSSEFLNKPTLMILFDQLRKNISLIHRKSDNSIETKILSPYQNVSASNLSGDCTFDDATDEITGVDTLFLSELNVSDLLYYGGVYIGKVKQIKSDTLVILTDNANTSGTGVAISLYKNVYAEKLELTISGSPMFGEGIWITIKKNGELITSYKQAGDLPTARMGSGWYVSMGTRSNLALDFGDETSAPTNVNSMAYVGDVEIVGLPPKLNTEETDLTNQRHFVKSIGGSAYQKPLLGQLMLAGNTEFRDYAYKSNHSQLDYRYLVQEFTPLSRTTGETELFPHLLELLVEDTRRDNVAGDFLDGPSIKFFEYTAPATPDITSYIGAEITAAWIDGELKTQTDIAQAGFNVPNNSLIQFDISAAFETDNLTPSTKYYLVVKVPKGVNIARAKGFDKLSTEVFVDNTDTALPEGIPAGDLQGTGWQIVPWMWFKLFHGFRERYENVFHGASIQMRVVAESHALVSSEASGLSETVIVDREGPKTLDEDLILDQIQRPAITTVLQPGLRSTVINISADDALSGNWLFRVAKETDFGTVFYSEWLDWEAFKKRDESGNLIDDEAIYSIYHYGSWSKTPNGLDDPYTNSSSYDPQNLGTDGPRRIWVETMDKVGNITQSYPVTVNAQLMGLVDTTAPTSSVEIIAPDGIALDYTNETNVIVQISANDSVSSVKDVRFRLIDGNGVGDYSAWFPYSDVIKQPLVSNSPNAFAAMSGDENPEYPDSGNYFSTANVPGLKRIEVQTRDYGNNAQQPSGVWNTLYKDSYLSRNEFSAFGITEFNRDLIIVDEVTWLDPNTNIESVYLSAIKFFEFIPSQLTFEAITSWSGENENAYEIKSLATGLYNRKIYVGNNDTITLVINGTEYNRAASASDETVAAPKFYVDSSKGYLVVVDLPSSTPTSLFECTIYRSESQIWKWNSNSFEKVLNLGPSGERVILCMLPLKNRILLGSGNGKLWSYDGLNVSGPIFETADLSGNIIPITTICLHQFMHETKSYVYLGTGSKSFMFRAPIDGFLVTNSWERLSLEPINDKSLTITALTSAYNALFIGTDSGKVFKYNRKINKTNASIVTQVTSTFNLSKSEIDVYESSVLPVADIYSFANQVMAGIGDRPEIHSYSERLRPLPGINNEIIGDHNFSFIKLSDVKYATASALTGTWTYANTTLSRTTNAALSIDGSTPAVNDRVLIKNQATTLHNGIYVVTQVGSASQKTILTRAMDFYYQSKITGNTNVAVTAGSANINTVFYLSSDDYIEVGVDNNTWSQTPTSFAHYFAAWSTTQFSNAFIRDPAGWGWQFYHNGNTNPRENLEIINPILIDEKYSESGLREVMSLTGFADQATVFTAEDGSDWEQAVNRKPTVKEPFCLDFELRHSAGSGSQGFEVADGFHIVNVKFSTSSVTLTSGTSTVTKSFYNRDDVFTPYSVIEQKYPQLGMIQTWNFALEAADEDTNPINPEGYGKADTQGWIAKKFATVQALAEPGKQIIIDATLATTANLNATYNDGANVASPGVGANLEFNAVGAQTIDSVAIAEGINLATTLLSVNFDFEDNYVDLTLPSGTWDNATASSYVGKTFFTPAGRILGTCTKFTLYGSSSYARFELDRKIYKRPSDSTFTQITTLYLGSPYYILVKDQTNKSQNGLYEVYNKGYTDLKAKFLRASIFDEKSEMSKNTVVVIGSTALVNGATNNSKIFYFYTEDGSIIIGETFIDWYNTTATTTVGEDHYLEITSSLEGGVKGDPIVGVENLTPFIADTNTYLLVRLKFSDVTDENQDLINDFDETVRVATVENITLSGTTAVNQISPTSAVSISASNRVLVKSQDDPKENGVYIVAVGSWTRATTNTSGTVSTNPTNYLTTNSRIKVTNGSFANDIFYMHYDGILKLGITDISYNTTIFNPTIKMRTYWSSVGSVQNFEDYRFNSTFISIKNKYDTFIINPAWIGPVRSLYFEFEDFSKYQFNIKPKIEIDYVSVLTNAGHFTITKELTPVRLALSGSNRTDVRLWIGNYEDPIIEQDNFAVQESDKSYIRFGKLTPDPSSSTWIWGSVRYHIGHVIPPVFAEKQGFYPSFRFPSAGGVRKILTHSGSAWCLTDGYYNKATTDNPDDSIFKAWSYLPDEEIWKLESPNASKIGSTKGLIRALAAVSYRDTLIVSGQVGVITNQNSLPSEI